MDRWNGCINCSAGYVLFVRLKLGDESCAFVTVRYATLSWISETACCSAQYAMNAKITELGGRIVISGYSHDPSSNCTRKASTLHT